ncbi:hypothetical protein QLX08_004337 [Tetragonisca angustula]|uniref:Uncharacterized protein n=1 Tax=Tetragonisca angustula TaxID=166442 RepID=A0AAW1A2R8_9HYME
MEVKNKRNEITGSGSVGGEVGIASQPLCIVIGQACSAFKKATEIRKKDNKTAIISSTEVDTESEGSYQAPRGKKKIMPKPRSTKRGRPSPTEESNSKKRLTSDFRNISDEDEEEEYFLNSAV